MRKKKSTINLGAKPREDVDDAMNFENLETLSDPNEEESFMDTMMHLAHTSEVEGKLVVKSSASKAEGMIVVKSSAKHNPTKKIFKKLVDLSSSSGHQHHKYEQELAKLSRMPDEDPTHITVIQSKPSADFTQSTKDRALDTFDDENEEEEDPKLEEEEEHQGVDLEQAANVHDHPVDGMVDNLESGANESDFHFDFAPPQILVHTTQEMSPRTNGVIIPHHPIIRTPSDMNVSPSSSVVDSGQRWFVTALGARHLAQTQRFGTQTPYCELQIGQAVVRTEGHKKGGSSAEWNQAFVLNLVESEPVLQVRVKHANGLIGTCSVDLTPYEDEVVQTSFFGIFAGTKAVGEVQLKIRLGPHQAPVLSPVTAIAGSSSSSPHTEDMPDDDDDRRRRRIPQTDEFIHKGTLMTKVPFHRHTGTLKRQWFAVEEGGAHVGSKEDGLVLHWGNPSSHDIAGYIRLRDVQKIHVGPDTPAFDRQMGKKKTKLHPECCFSLETASRTLDIVANSEVEARGWMEALCPYIYTPEKIKLVEGLTKQPHLDMNSLRNVALTARSSSSSFGLREKRWLQTLFVSARKGDIVHVASIYSEGCPVDLMEPGSGDTTLLIACRLDNLALAKLALTWRAKNDPHPDFGSTALQASVQAKSARCARLLLEAAAQSSMDSEIVNHAGPRRDAPIHVAAAAGDMPCLELIIHHGADVRLVDDQGQTALHCATRQSQSRAAAYLLDVGADQILDVGDHRGNTPLHCATELGAADLVQLLLESAARVHVVNSSGHSPLDLASSHEVRELLQAYVPDDESCLDQRSYSRCLMPGEEAQQREWEERSSYTYQVQEDPTSGHGYSSSSARSLVREALSRQPIYPVPDHHHEYHDSALGYSHDDQYDDVDHWHHSRHVEQESYPTEITTDVSFVSRFYSQSAWWDSHYTEDGHVYFVQVSSGESQWADPRLEPQLAPPPVPTNSSPTKHPQDLGHLSAGNLIRKQLGQVRNSTTLPGEFAALRIDTGNSRVASSEALDAAELEELEALFHAASSSTTGENAACFQKSRASSPKGKSQSIALLDTKRANNIAVGLALFKHFESYEKLIQDVINMDTTAFTAEVLFTLKQLLPTSIEKKKVLAYTGEIEKLGKAEQFFRTTASIPTLDLSVDCFLFRLRFFNDIHDIQARVQKWTDTSQRMCHSTALMRILKKLRIVSQAVLPVPDDDDDAQEHMSSLVTRSMTLKGKDGVTTILDYVLKSLLGQVSPTELDVSEEISALDQVCLSSTELTPYRELENESQRFHLSFDKVQQILDLYDPDKNREPPHPRTSGMTPEAFCALREFFDTGCSRLSEMEAQFRSLEESLALLMEHIGSSTMDKVDPMHVFHTLRPFLQACQDSSQQPKP